MYSKFVKPKLLNSKSFFQKPIIIGNYYWFLKKTPFLKPFKASELKEINSTETENWKQFLKFLDKVSFKEPTEVKSDNEKDYFNSLNQRYYVTQDKKLLKNKSAPKDAERCISFLKKNPKLSLGCNLRSFKLQYGFMVCDIDQAYAGQKIIDWAKSDNLSETVSFKATFGTPVVIQTKTPGHVHLWYKDASPFNDNTIKACSRIGIPIEYRFANVELISSERKIIKAPSSLTHDAISELPNSLYPYDYHAKPNFLSLAEGAPLQANTHKDALFIKEGRRNTTLFNFFRVDNFSKEIVLATNRILCNPPLPNEEVISCFQERYSKLNSTTELKPNEMRKNSCNFHTSTFEKVKHRSNEEDSYLMSNPATTKSYKDVAQLISSQKKDVIAKLQAYKFSPHRAYQCAYDSTPTLTILLVAFLEQKYDTFYNSDLYKGVTPEKFIVSLFLNVFKKKSEILFITDEENWYMWEKTKWVLKKNELIDGVFQDFLEKHISYGGLETRFTKTGTYRSLLQVKVSCETWPLKYALGLNFQNFVALANDKKELIEVPHDPSFYHRSQFPCNFNPNATLDHVQMRFILDVGGENAWSINVFRYVLYIILTSTGNQVGVYLNSEPGGSKSSFVRLLQEIFHQAVVPLNINELKNDSTFQSDYSAHKKVLVISEIGPQNSQNENLTNFIKRRLGGDSQLAQKKYQNFYQDSSMPVVILTSNEASSQSSLFHDEAIKDRLIDLQTPTIKGKFKHQEIEKYVSQNLEGLINWAIQMPIDMLTNFIRVNPLNQVFSSSNNCMDEFAKSELLIVPRIIDKHYDRRKLSAEEKMAYATILYPYEDLKKNFQEYLINNDYPLAIQKKFNSQKSVKEEFYKTLEKLIPEQQSMITDNRTAKSRGVANLTTKKRAQLECNATAYGLVPRSEIVFDSKVKITGKTEGKILNHNNNESKTYSYIGSKQYKAIVSLKLKDNYEVIDILNNHDPFYYNGVLTQNHNQMQQFVQTNQLKTSSNLCQYSHNLASQVRSLSCKELITTFPPAVLKAATFQHNENNEYIINSDYITPATNMLQPKESALSINYKQRGPSLWMTDFHTKQVVTQQPFIENQNQSGQFSLPQSTIDTNNFITGPYGSKQPAGIEEFLYFNYHGERVQGKALNVKKHNYQADKNMFIVETTDHILLTKIPDSYEEVIFRQLMRETGKQYLQLLDGIFPTQEDFMLSVLINLYQLNQYPLLLQNNDAWCDFLKEDFFEYKHVFQNWNHEVTEYMVSLFYVGETANQTSLSLYKVLTSNKNQTPIISSEELEYYKKMLTIS